MFGGEVTVFDSWELQNRRPGAETHVSLFYSIVINLIDGDVLVSLSGRSDTGAWLGRSIGRFCRRNRRYLGPSRHAPDKNRERNYFIIHQIGLITLTWGYV